MTIKSVVPGALSPPGAEVFAAPYAPMGPIIAGTSNSVVSVAVGLNSTFIMNEFNLGFQSGMRLRAGDVSDIANLGGLEGVCVSYDPRTNELVILPDLIIGSGSYNNWFITVTGVPGEKGDQGAVGPVGPTGPSGGPQGPQGDEGPQGVPGMPSMLVGSFGAITTPDDLPIGGFLPADFDGPGRPVADTQLLQGMGLLYDPDGHMWVFVTDFFLPAGWVDGGEVRGPQGLPGAPGGPEGPEGPEGPIGPPGLDGLNGLGGGMVNRFRNGAMDVWQRPIAVTGIPITPGANPLVYTADGWIVTMATGSVVAAQSAGNVNTLNSLRLTGTATAATDATVMQRIESRVASPLGVVSVTVQALIFNGTPAPFTPQINVAHAATEPDNFSNVIDDLAPVNLQPCPIGAWTRVAYAFQAPQTSAQFGLQISFIFPALSGTANYVQITECDIRATPGAAIGLINNPADAELRPIAYEMTFCQRYYTASVVNSWANVFSGYALSGGVYYTYVRHPAPMRVTPTVSLTNASAVGFPAVVGTVGASTAQGFSEGRTANVTGTSYFGSSYTAAAEL